MGNKCKIINNVASDAVINTTNLVDEENILQFVLSTIEERKAKNMTRARMIFLNSAKKILAKISLIKHFSDHMNMPVKEGKVIRKICSKKGSYSLVHTMSVAIS